MLWLAMTQGCTSDGSNFPVHGDVSGRPSFFFCWEKVGGGRGQEGKVLRGRGRMREHGKETREAGGGKGGATRRDLSWGIGQAVGDDDTPIINREAALLPLLQPKWHVWQEDTLHCPILLPRSSTSGPKHRPSSPRSARTTFTCHSTLRHGSMLSGCSVLCPCSTFPRSSALGSCQLFTSPQSIRSSQVRHFRGNLPKFKAGTYDSEVLPTFLC